LMAVSLRHLTRLSPHRVALQRRHRLPSCKATCKANSVSPSRTKPPHLNTLTGARAPLLLWPSCHSFVLSPLPRDAYAQAPAWLGGLAVVLMVVVDNLLCCRLCLLH